VDDERLDAAGSGGSEDGTVGSPRTGSDPKPWDFRQTTRFSAETVRAIRRVFDHWGPLLQTSLAPIARMPVKLGELKLETMSYETYARQPADHGIVAVLNASAFGSPFLFRLDEELALGLLDRELGGPGFAVPRARGFSPMELQVMQGQVEGIVRVLEEVWRVALNEVTLELVRLDNANQLQAITSPTEAIVWVQQEVTLGTNRGAMHVILPYPAVEPVLLQLVTGRGGESPAKTGERPVLRPFVGLRHVRVEARLGPAVLSAAQVQALRPGDVVALPIRLGQGFWMTVEGRPAFLVHDIGRVGIRTAVRVAQLLPRSVLESLSHSVDPRAQGGVS
jgi:flagellar motor switch protein FliM